MIIYGTTGRNVDVGGGQFHCPTCGMDSTYKHCEVKRYFTLYFIPLIPMGSAGEFVECIGCGGSWSPEILTYDPEAAHEETVAVVRRLAALFLLDVRRCNSTTLKALQEHVSDALDYDVEREDIARDVKQAQRAEPDTKQFFKKQSSELSDDGKLLVTALLKKILEAEGPMSDAEANRIIELGKAMGVRAKHVRQAIEYDGA